MGHLGGLSRLGVELNPPHMGDWPWKIGQFVLNFGAIELMSYQYLNSLEATRDDFDRNLDRLLGPRIDRIVALLAATVLPQPAKAEMLAAWLEAKELSKWRNRIAHNPVLPTWKTSDPDKEPPDLIGIPDIKQLKGSDGTDSISRKSMEMLIDASADLGKRLHAASGHLNDVA
jgi:hypothetical protein